MDSQKMSIRLDGVGPFCGVKVHVRLRIKVPTQGKARNNNKQDTEVLQSAHLEYPPRR
jgi:hypothetical protein